MSAPSTSAHTSQRDRARSLADCLSPEPRGLTSAPGESPLRSFTAGLLVGFGACLVLVAFVGVLR